MGRQRDSKLVGTVSNLIFYNFRGEYCVRTKPVSVAPFITSQFLHAPVNTIRIIFKMVLIGMNLNKAETEFFGHSEIGIPYSVETFHPQNLLIPTFVKPGNLIIMVMAVQ